MKTLLKTLTLFTALSISATSSHLAYAGPYTDDLSKCLVKSTTDADKHNLVRWIYAMMSTHPELSVMSSISETQKLEANKAIAGIFDKLLLNACNAELQAAQKYEGESAIETAFEMLGKVSVGELFSNPQVNKEMAVFVQYIPQEHLEKMFAPKK